MDLHAVPLFFALIGLILYTVLGGADFGAGLWQLSAGSGRMGARIREHAEHAIAPVWEANHVWLIFVLTVVWTAYPAAFGSMASTLSVPLFVAGIGMVLRGAAYALHAGADPSRTRLAIDTVFSLSSILTPFALGAAVGGIASRRVPVGNAAGDLVSSWLNPTSIMIGILAVAIAAFLAAVYLAADALRQVQPVLAQQFRARALGSGVLAGALSVGGLVVLRADSPALYRGLTSGAGLVALISCVLAGVLTMGLVLARRFTVARYTAALAVASIVAGWALAQQPVFLPGLTVRDAAAPRDTLIAVTMAVLGGAVILFPSLGLLFRLVLRGRFDPERSAVDPDVPARPRRGRAATRLPARIAGACLLVGIGLLTVAESGWAHAVGVLALVGFVVAGFAAVAPDDLAATDRRPEAHR
ncbi:MAG: cytochrome d ubiquinol oxidase subunit II [Sciscionella sp.]